MHKLFTSEDVIRFAYDEMPEDEVVEFRQELIECPEMAAELRIVNEAKNLIDTTFETPSNAVLQRVLNYSKSLKFYTSAASPKPIEVVLN
jgi:hypothetical protein